MKAEVRKALAVKRSPAHLAWCEVLFTLSQARRALPYIARVAHDASHAYHLAQRCRAALNDELTPQQRDLINERREKALHRLNDAIDECNAAGVDLVDLPTGQVRFNAHVNNQRVSLIWKLNEPIENAWQEWDDIDSEMHLPRRG